METNKRADHNRVAARGRTLQHRRGATVVEFAIIFPLLITMLLGIMEFGWLVKNNLLVANAAREGARAAALGKTTTEITARVQNSVQPLSVASPNGSITMFYSTNNGADKYPYPLGDSGSQNNAQVASLIKITVTSRHRPLTSFFPFLNNRNVEAYATMRREVASTA